MNEKSFRHTLKGVVEAAERFGKVKVDHERWMEINKMTFTAKGECGENHTLAQRLDCAKCKEIAKQDKPTLIYYVQTVLNTFKRSEEQGYHTKDRQYAIELLEKAMECQNDIWNDAIEEAAKLTYNRGSRQCMNAAMEIRKLKK